MKETGERLTVGKIVAAGSNYADHAREMGTPRPKAPVLFFKPSTSILHVGEPIRFPEIGSTLHHEVELGLLIGRTCRNVPIERAREYVLGYLLALDLTLRDLQQEAKEKGRPWATSKGFDCACPVSDVLPLREELPLGSFELTLSVNGESRQSGSTGDMIWSPLELVVAASRCFTLERGDILLTGTPAGVGPLERGDRVEARLGSALEIGFDVV